MCVTSPFTLRRQLGFAPDGFPMSEDDYDIRLSFPVFPQMTNAQQDFVNDSIKGAFAQT